MQGALVKTFIQIVKAGMNHPNTRQFAIKLFKNISTGGPKAEAASLAGQISSRLKGVGVKGFKKINQKISNLAEVGKPIGKSGSNQILKNEYYYNAPTGTAGTGYFGKYNQLPMIDIDIADVAGSHSAAQIVHQTKDAALRGVKKFLKTKQGKKTRFDVQETPGGIRLFNLSKRTVPRKHAALDKKLGGDPWYRMMSQKRNAFAARLSPKPGREGDYVSKRIGQWGEGKVNPRSLYEVENYHDAIIRKIIASSSKDTISAGGLFNLL
jgi:hypothetical protein